MTLKMQKGSFNPLKLLLKIPVPWVYILTYLIGLVFQILFPFQILSQDKLYIVKIIGIVLFLIGLIFASWSLIIFHKASTTTTPGESSRKLITHGPYKITRNPMNVSLVLAHLGEAGFLTQIWPLFTFPLIVAYVNWVVIPLEEDILKKDYSEEYEDYCARVRRWL